MASAAMPAIANFLMSTSFEGGWRMGIRASAINLQFGNQAHSYQDLIPFTIGNTQNQGTSNARQLTYWIMPSSRGSHSEISGT